MNGQAFLQHWPLIRQVLQDHIDLDKVRYSQHAGERMEGRMITKRMVESILYHNDPTEMHEVKKYPFGEQPFTNADPVLTVVGIHEDRKIAVSIADQIPDEVKPLIAIDYDAIPDSYFQKVKAELGIKPVDPTQAAKHERKLLESLEQAGLFKQ
ncbi:DUF4258 domain-containing protein [Paenibacillus lentus]|uniref:Uncharacterized protein n=1 Tax=Paenibacillus lentus TaxID=1338368 RepID=A0A3Q8S605_9BACL|nr:DUF4258 domain-containing protein [Paenibacillus lentus]AZK47845.1 hypothetical protein EIM92_18130 [Paenibacillus lentus]